MFRSGSPYSPFFTSGLLSSSSLPDTDLPALRRGSLPTPSAPDPSECRSFLSLDLADARSSHRSGPARQSSLLLPRRPSSPASLRCLPHPKPAPAVPIPDAPPRLPSIAVNSTLDLSLTAFELESHVLPALPPKQYRFSKMTTSTVSTRARRANRSHALARLEGRTNSTRRRPAPPPLKSMWDDDDDEEDFVPVQANNEDEDAEDLPEGLTLSAILEPEDLVIPTDDSHPKPTLADNRFPRSVVLSHSRNSSQAALASPPSDWLPLKSFIDFHVDDDMSRWSWRSFIEVAKFS